MDIKTIYRPRIIDILLQQQLSAVGAVLIEGPKQCGKTSSAVEVCNSRLYMSNPTDLKRNLSLAKLNPGLLLRGKTPRLIDEWQIAPELWDTARFEIDHRREVGQFIFTGSAVPADRSKIFHSGTGRFAWLKMRTMSLFESGESNGQVSLRELFDGHLDIACTNAYDLEAVAFLACRGGWPAALGLPAKAALLHAANYYDAIVNTDISRVDNVERNPNRVKRLLRSYARNQGSQTPISALVQDMQLVDSETENRKTVASYLNALQQIFVIEDLKAWNPNLRSKTAIRTSDTRYFSDPSLCATALGIGPHNLVLHPETFGFIFETLCIRDLRVYADALDGEVYHYRDKNNLECDAVLQRRNGSFGLIEIKLGGDAAVERGASTLRMLAAKIDVEKMGKPSFLMVLTAVGDFAYQREDGVLVVPICCLRD